MPFETMRHSMDAFATLVKVLLGETAVAPRKLECMAERGAPLCILGLDVSIMREGIQCRPRSADAFCLKQLRALFVMCAPGLTK